MTCNFCLRSHPDDVVDELVDPNSESDSDSKEGSEFELDDADDDDSNSDSDSKFGDDAATAAVASTATSTPTTPTPKKTSQYRGVCWDKKQQKWQARITVRCSEKNLGTYDDESAAARAYDAEARKLGRDTNFNVESKGKGKGKGRGKGTGGVRDIVTLGERDLCRACYEVETKGVTHRGHTYDENCDRGGGGGSNHDASAAEMVCVCVCGWVGAWVYSLRV